MALELSFNALPLLVAFVHPVLMLWQVSAVREATTRLFPSVASFFPEYDFVAPPPPLPHSTRFLLPPIDVLVEEKDATEDEQESLNTI